MDTEEKPPAALTDDKIDDETVSRITQVSSKDENISPVLASVNPAEQESSPQDSEQLMKFPIDTCQSDKLDTTAHSASEDRPKTPTTRQYALEILGEKTMQESEGTKNLSIFACVEADLYVMPQNPRRCKQQTFDGRFKQLKDFKSKFGHCNVTQSYSMDPSLGNWCSTMRRYYNQIQKGQKSKGNLTQDQIARLEEIGFKWGKVKFEQRCRDLEAFKSEFGHCNVPCTYSANPSLGQWCNNMRYYYNQIQQGQKSNCNLTQDQIARLEEIGFKCKVI
jgi:hypothetical protein